MDKETQAWNRQRDDDGKLESNLWYDRFTAYRLKGASRSLLGCVNEDRVTRGRKRSNYSPGSWRRAAKKWNWDKRAMAWDEYKRAEDEAQWDDRRCEIREREWSQAGTLLGRVEQMLKFPLAQIDRVDRTDADGRPLAVTVVKPVRWSQRDITRFMQVSSELARLAAEMEQRRQALDVTTGGEPLPQGTITIIEHGEPNGSTNGD